MPSHSVLYLIGTGCEVAALLSSVGKFENAMASYSAPMRSLTPVRQSPGMDAAASARAQQQHRANAAQQLRAPFVQQQPSGPVAILWDIENCSVPGEVNAEDVAGNIRIALREHPFIGAVTMFSAYGDFNQFPRKVREGCQRTGVNLIDVPNGKKDAADKAILVDMFLFALDNPPPSTIFLITGDVDFAPALHKLGQRGYMVVLVIPDGVGVSSALRGAGRFVWDWSCLCRGDGFVAATKTGPGRAPNTIYRVEERIPVNQGRVSNNMYSVEERLPVNQYQNAYADYNAGPWAADEPDPRNDDNVFGEEILAWRVRSNAYNVDSAHSYSPVHPENVDYGHLQYGIPGQVQPQGPRMNAGNATITRSAVSAPPSMRNQVSSGFPSRSLFPTPEAGHVVTPTVQQGSQIGELVPLTDLSEPTSPGGSSATAWVQPGDLPGLKRQLVKLLKLNGGKMALPRVPAEYCKQFGRPLYLAEYNALKLVHLIEKMKDTLAIKGDGTSKTLHLAKKETRGVTNKYKPVGNRGSAPKSDKDKYVADHLHIVDC